MQFLFLGRIVIQIRASLALTPQVKLSLKAKGRTANISSKELNQAKQDWRTGLRLLLHKHHLSSSADKVREGHMKQKETRGAARDVMLALDHALQWVGSGLSVFFQE